MLGVYNLLAVEIRTLDPCRNSSRLRYEEFLSSAGRTFRQADRGSCLAVRFAGNLPLSARRAQVAAFPGANQIRDAGARPERRMCAESKADGRASGETHSQTRSPISLPGKYGP